MGSPLLAQRFQQDSMAMVAMLYWASESSSRISEFLAVRCGREEQTRCGVAVSAISSGTTDRDTLTMANPMDMASRTIPMPTYGQYGEYDDDAMYAQDDAQGLVLQREQSLVGVSSTVTAHGVPLLSYTRTMNRFYTSRKQKLSFGRFKCGWDSWWACMGEQRHAVALSAGNDN